MTVKKRFGRKLYSSSEAKILDWFRLREFADNKFIKVKLIEFGIQAIEKNVNKGKHAFSLFYISKGSLFLGR